MRKVSNTLVQIVFVCCLLLGWTGPVFAGPSEGNPVLVVDYVYLINHHPDTANANNELKKQRDQKQKEFTEKASGLNDKEKQDLDQKLRGELEKQRLELLKPILDNINETLRVVAQEKGATAVFYKNTVAWGGMDITEEVLKKLTAK